LLVYGLQGWLFPSEPPATTEAVETVAPEGVTPEEAERLAAEAATRATARLDLRATATIRTDRFEADVDNLAGGISHFRLLGDRYADPDGTRLDLVTTAYDQYRPLRIELPGAPIPDDAVWEITQESDTSVLLRWEGEGLVVTRRFEAGRGPYQIWQTVNVRNVGTATRHTRLTVHAYHYVERAEESSGFMGMGSRSSLISEGLCRHDEDIERKDREALLEAHGYGGAVDFVGVENAYFVTALAAGETDQPAERCGMYAADFAGADGEDHGSLFHVELSYPETDIDPGSEHNWRVLTYVGPKDWAALETAGHSLEEVVNLGTFAIIARAFAQLLAAIHGFTGNWGLAIILLTLMVRIALFPLMERQFRSMAPMRKLKPELDEISKRFPDDLEKRQAAQMELYRKHGINPASQMLGCLPLLLQMPVFFALYTSLSTNVELYHQPFYLYWTDLSAPDPYFVLPLMLVALMHLQQRITPNTMDPQQARIMMVVMPIMMGVFMLFLPSGLCLYMLTNSLLGIGQQQLNLYRTARDDERTKAAEVAAAAAAPVVTGDVVDDPNANKKPNAGASARRDKRRPSRG
jgi:YidC/Oxa1 family membrane protein insertase